MIFLARFPKLTLVATASSHQSATISRSFSAQAPFAWKLLHGKFDFDKPLTQPMSPPYKPPADLPAPPQRSPIKVSTLENGLRVASQDLGGPVSSVALFVNAGARYENPINSGVSHLIERLAFKGTAEIPREIFVKQLEALGASFGAAAARETIAYLGEGIRSDLMPIVYAISQGAIAPAVMAATKGHIYYDIANAELNLQKDALVKHVSDMMKDPANLVNEALHAVAFGGASIGMPLAAEERKINSFNPETVVDFIKALYTADRMVLSATNVDHEALVNIANQAFQNVQKSPVTVNNPATYIGGQTRLSGDGFSHFAIGFQGVSWSDKDLVPVCILHTLMGGGGSFSSGGPGKGMYTRLYTNILNHHGFVHSAVAFNNVYSDTGLFGISASADPDRIADLVQVVTEQAVSMGKNLTSEEVSRAKNQTKSSLIMNLESRAVVCEDIGRQILTTGKYIPMEELVAQIDAVTADDLKRVAERITSSKPSTVVYGDMHPVPTYEAIAGAFTQKALN